MAISGWTTIEFSGALVVAMITLASAPFCWTLNGSVGPPNASCAAPVTTAWTASALLLGSSSETFRPRFLKYPSFRATWYGTKLVSERPNSAIWRDPTPSGVAAGPGAAPPHATASAATSKASFRCLIIDPPPNLGP